jgi:hypothetical protein
MILCPACRRHLLAVEPECPFCGLALAPPPARAPSPAMSPELSRAQRYAIGTALAASVAGIGCNRAPSTIEPSPEPSSAQEPVDAAPPPAASTPPGAPAPSSTGGSSPAPALLADAGAADAGAADAGAAAPRKWRPPPPPPPPPDFEGGGQRENWHPHSCWKGRNGKMVCPPYGCVFPDEDCTVVRA